MVYNLSRYKKKIARQLATLYEHSLTLLYMHIVAIAIVLDLLFIYL